MRRARIGSSARRGAAGGATASAATSQSSACRSPRDSEHVTQQKECNGAVRRRHPKVQHRPQPRVAPTSSLAEPDCSSSRPTLRITPARALPALPFRVRKRPLALARRSGRLCCVRRLRLRHRHEGGQRCRVAHETCLGRHPPSQTSRPCRTRRPRARTGLQRTGRGSHVDRGASRSRCTPRCRRPPTPSGEAPPRLE